MTHDGMWFYHCLSELGIAKANQLNKAAIKSLAPVEIGRIKRALGLEKIETFEQFKSFCQDAFNLFIPDFMGACMSFPEKNILQWEFIPQRCFAYRGMQTLGVIDDYECGVIYRVACWLDSLGMEYIIDPPIEKCMMHVKGHCAGSFRLNFG
jgi:hypothetical protein